jgi:DNA-binding LacI/PurR family transcriptional regulator
MKTSSLATMESVARKAGVSITTVSHVINKTRHVSQETMAAVIHAIEELNYRSVKMTKPPKTTVCIGVILADAREDYFTAMIKAVESVADDYGISIIFCDSEMDPEKEEKNITTLVERTIDGLLLAPVAVDHVPKSLKKTSLPVVLIDRQYETHNFLFVGINNFQSGYAGTKHLFEKGCKHIGFIGYSTSVYTINQRILGYKAFMAENNPPGISRSAPPPLVDRPCIPKVLTLNYNREDSFPLIRRFILEEGLDGLLCATSTLCYELIEVLDTLDAGIQKGLKIITFDDNRWFDYLKYPVSVISQPVAEIGNAALENLLQMIEQKNSLCTVKRELLFDTTIIDRNPLPGPG